MRFVGHPFLHHDLPLRLGAADSHSEGGSKVAEALLG